MPITNDEDFKHALHKLPLVEQRQLAARFAQHVAPLNHDPRVGGVITAALNLDITDKELAKALQEARHASVESYTQCGTQGDWLCQASHFVAKAALDSVSPTNGEHNLAWDAAMHARMARTCEAIAKGSGTDNREANEQYRIAEQALGL